MQMGFLKEILQRGICFLPKSLSLGDEPDVFWLRPPPQTYSFQPKMNRKAKFCRGEKVSVLILHPLPALAPGSTLQPRGSPAPCWQHLHMARRGDAQPK